MKPNAILSQLEREPVVFLGGYHTPILCAVRKGLLLGAVTATSLTVTGALFLRPPVLIPLWMLSFLLAALVYTRRRLYRIASQRTGKPLFHEQHMLTHKSARWFIQPNARYQLKRNVQPELAKLLIQRKRERRVRNTPSNTPFVFPWGRTKTLLPDPAETAVTDTGGDNTLPATADTGTPPATADALPEIPMRAAPRLTLNKTDDQE